MPARYLHTALTVSPSSSCSLAHRRTLMSVDDVIAAVINLCEELSVASNTFFFYSSDQ